MLLTVVWLGLLHSSEPAYELEQQMEFYEQEGV